MARSKRGLDKTGMQFGDCAVLEKVNSDDKMQHYKVKCICGEELILRSNKITEDYKCTHNLKCKICGKSIGDDTHFWIGACLCNRHALQIRRHGDVLPSEKEKEISFDRVCTVCGDTEHNKYYVWHGKGEYHRKPLCGKHYNQMLKNGEIIDPTPSEHIPRHDWTDEEEQQLIQLYKEGWKFEDIAIEMGRTINAINSKSYDLKLGDKYMRPNNPNFKAVYQDYDWCYERFINQGKNMHEMAEEAGATLRVITKWCSEVHGLNAWTFRKIKQLSDIQKQIIMAGCIGDGHIDRRADQPMYIESHAENQKDYVYWKYTMLKDLCGEGVKYIPPKKAKFQTDKEYQCRASYRFETRILDALYEIREMSVLQIIDNLTELGVAIHFLDDASCTKGYWSICVAGWTFEEKAFYKQTLLDKFGICLRDRKDDRYFGLGKADSAIVTEIILRNIPNDLDIIKYKIGG